MILKCESCGRSREWSNGHYTPGSVRCLYCGGMMLSASADGALWQHQPYLTACPYCKNVFEVSEEYSGQTTKCPECGSPFVISRYVPSEKSRKHSNPVRIALPSSRKPRVVPDGDKQKVVSDFTVYTAAAVEAAKYSKSESGDIGVGRLEGQVELLLDRDRKKLSRYIIACGVVLGCVMLLATVVVFSVWRNNRRSVVAVEDGQKSVFEYSRDAFGQTNGVETYAQREQTHIPTLEKVESSHIADVKDVKKSEIDEGTTDVSAIGTELPTTDVVKTNVASVLAGIDSSVQSHEGDSSGEAIAHTDELAGDVKVDVGEGESTEAAEEETARPWSRYMVIDLSAGPDAKDYPVRWLAEEPAKGWSDSYKTTKLVLRRIEPGKFMMGSPEDELGRSENERIRLESIRHPYYIGVFEVTRRQYQLVTGRGIVVSDAGGKRPATVVSWESIRGNRFEHDWPTKEGVEESSFMGLLCRKTGLENIDIPTESQWEYACRAGSDTAFSDGSELTTKFRSNELANIGRYVYNPLDGDSSMAEDVGRFLPNAWGLYDMHGNVWEWCLDSWNAIGKSDARQLGAGELTQVSVPNRVVRGGSYASFANECRSASRSSRKSSGSYDDVGFRVCCVAETAASPKGKGIAEDVERREVTGCRLSVGRPKVVKKTASSQDTGSGFSYRNESTRYVSVSKYSGKVGCNVSKGELATVNVEAYFVVKEIGDDTAERIASVKTLGRFVFGDGKPPSYDFAFESPEVSETKSSTSQSGSYYYGGYRKTTRTGTRYMGVIVRMIVDGEVKKVVSVPSNQRWNKAGKEHDVVLE